MSEPANSGPRSTAIVLAAGLASRFGGGKLTATLDGRPVLQHVLDALAVAGIDDPVVVVGTDSHALEPALDWRRARRVKNPDPERGMSHSLQLGWAAAMSAVPRPDFVIVALGDQPMLDSTLVLGMLAEPADPARPVLGARHEDGSRNPVRLEPAADALVAEASGDRGLGPIMNRHPELVRELRIPGAFPDVDRPTDLVDLVAASWSQRVRANAEQVERVRATPDGTDFYAPVTATFVADPARTDDPVLDALLGIAAEDDVWLDIGAGAGRYALPLARAVREVAAVDPSNAMLQALRGGAADAGIANVRTIAGRWPPDEALRSELGQDPIADIALMAHVGYDIDPILPFLDAMELAARRRCVAVLMVESPASVAAPFWPIVHGEARISLPALPQFLELLAARRAGADVVMVAGERRRWPNRDELVAFLRRQLWIVAGSPADQKLGDALVAMTTTAQDGSIEMAEPGPRDIGIVSWPGRGQ